MRDTRPAEKLLIYKGLRALRDCGTFSRHTLYIGFMCVAHLKKQCIYARAHMKSIKGSRSSRSPAEVLKALIYNGLRCGTLEKQVPAVPAERRFL